MKKNIIYAIAAAGIITFSNTGFAQPGRPAPAQAKPQPAQAKPQPGKPQPGKPQPAPAPRPATVQPPSAPRPATVQPPHAPQPAPAQPAPASKPVYHPGHKNLPIPAPQSRDYYKDWKRAQHHGHYHLNALPASDTMQAYLRRGQDIEFKLDETVRDGYRWFARSYSNIVDIDIDHENPWFSSPYAEIEIEGKFPGDTIVELIYARPNAWGNGEIPVKVIQLFVHID